MEKKTALVQLLFKALAIESVDFSPSSSTKGDTGSSSRHVADMYTSLLIDASLKLSFKARLLELLCFFGDAPAPFLLRLYLSQFITSCFPLRSSELKSNGDSEQLADYVSCVSKMLSAMELMSSSGGQMDLFEAVVNIYVREEEHVCERQIEASLGRMVRRSSGPDQLRLVTKVWSDVFVVDGADSTQNKHVYDERRMRLFGKVLLTLLAHCDKWTLVEFLISATTTTTATASASGAVIMDVMSELDGELREATYEAASARKRCMFELLELAYKRLYKDEMFAASARICVAYETRKFAAAGGAVKDGKELTKDVLRKCRKYMCEDVCFVANKVDDALARCARMQRQLHCAAFNCLVALFCRTQSEPKLYLAFLFKDDVDKVIMMCFLIH